MDGVGRLVAVRYPPRTQHWIAHYLFGGDMNIGHDLGHSPIKLESFPQYHLAHYLPLHFSLTGAALLLSVQHHSHLNVVHINYRGGKDCFFY